MKAADKEAASTVIRGLLQHARISKTISDLKRLEPAEDGRIRTVISPSGTWTGRPSFGETFLEKSTNLGNISSKFRILDERYDLREVVVADPGRLLASADLSQAEARVAAVLANEQTALAQYADGIDRYVAFAAGLYGLDESEIDKSRRAVGKMCILALERGVGWSKLLEQSNKWAELSGMTISAADAKKAEKLFHSMYPGYRRWWGEVRNEAMTRGYVRNLAGRRCDFFNRITSDYEQAELERKAVSFLCQGIADVLAMRLVDVYRRYDPKLLRLVGPMYVYDSIVFDAETAKMRRAAATVKRILEAPVDIDGTDVIIPVEVEVGERWSPMEQWL